MSVFVKICGICSRNDLEQICALEPDAIGFIFWPRAKRYVRPEQVASWMKSIPEQIKKVGGVESKISKQVRTHRVSATGEIALEGTSGSDDDSCPF